MSSPASNNFLIKNEIIRSWNGEYKDASIQRFRHLDTQCGICFSDFLPNDHITILPCSHGWHERCITQWTQVHKTCPADRSSASFIHTLTFSGHSFKMPLFTSQIFLSTTIKNIINSINKQPSLATSVQAKTLSDTVIIPLLQGLIDAENKKTPRAEITYDAEELFVTLFDFLEQNNIDLFDFFKSCGCYDDVIKLFDPINEYLSLFLYRTRSQPTMQPLNGARIYLEAAFRTQGFEAIWRNWRKSAYYKYLGTLRKLTSENEKRIYLHYLTPATKQFLKEESADHPNGPISQFLTEELPELPLIEDL